MLSGGIVSADDHLVEPPTVWTSRLPQRYIDVGPRLVRQRIKHEPAQHGELFVREADDGAWSDVWHYEDFRIGLSLAAASVGFDRRDVQLGKVVTYDDIRPGCFQQGPRLADMDVAGIEASLCFPNTFIRFCGQRFLFAKDKELALVCVCAYNDYVVEEWSGGSNNRLIACAIVPLWDAELAAVEIRRTATMGVPAVTFSECPPYLGLPSIHSGYWDPFFQACEETDTAIMLHVGSSSTLPMTSKDAPQAVMHALPSNNSAAALVDWVTSAKFVQFPRLKVCLAESNIGWVPYFLERMDLLWKESRDLTGLTPLTQPPSEYYYSNMFVTFFSDAFGAANLDTVGEDNAIFETDYPHGDSTWPDCLTVAEKQAGFLEPSVQEKVLRGNALRLFGMA